jgi:hypothetical protein
MTCASCAAHALCLQVSVAFISGFEGLSCGSPRATVQGVAAISVCWLFAAYVFVRRPSNDRLENWAGGGQFLCEGVSLLVGLLTPCNAPQNS